MKAEIIAVGTELLLGQVVNTNATFISEQLAGLGLDVYYQTVVGDNRARIEELLVLADTRSDLVVLCGGLGPTEDDLTKEVVAAHVGKPLVQDPQGYAVLLEFFKKSNRAMTENNLQQALTIEGSITLQNPNGLAVGSLYQGDKSTYLLLPGPPSELKPMFRQCAIPELAKVFPADEKLYSTVLRFYGIGESQLVTDLAELIETQTNPTIAPYAKENEVTLRITVKTADEAEAERLLKVTEEKIMARVGEFFYGYGDDNSLAAVVVDLLRQADQTVTAAESLTAGLFQSTLGGIPGVSEVFPGGMVTYSPQSKVAVLGVKEETIAKHGVVSEACAKEMAQAVLELEQTDFAVSFTGVAGPDALEGQAAGTVWIGLAKKDGTVEANCYQFNRNRAYVQKSAVMKGLDLIRRAILSEK
ncbi:competence/damage-inducible protein A [Enterococcus sp. JM4C]|uniref:competence/damage-inducible protein A n=1 Tax=Candidatus Enterococcus huntleyi TaxID=1857217 RepID=UPI00137B63F7|nr:competence/damage-inducible protein A [Enterococcus sp. JM4C]KAF1295202.1 competence/damage-inducible protein A [Enterococcus sp. JM4C]